MTNCTVRRVPTYRIVDNGSLHAWLGIATGTSSRAPTRDPTTNAAPEIPAFAGMTKCTIRTVLTYRVVDDGSLHAPLGISTGTSSQAPTRDLTTNGERDPGVRRDDRMRSPG